jgi:Ca2+-binding RTX toxin-like protein
LVGKIQLKLGQAAGRARLGGSKGVNGADEHVGESRRGGTTMKKMRGWILAGLAVSVLSAWTHPAAADPDCEVGTCVDNDYVIFDCDTGRDYIMFGTVREGLAGDKAEGVCVFEFSGTWGRGTLKDVSIWTDDADCASPQDFYVQADGNDAGTGGNDLVQLAPPGSWFECGSWGGSTWYIQGYFAAGAVWGYWGDLGDDRLFLSSQTTVDVNNNCSAPSSSESYDGNGGAAGEQGNDIVCGSYYGDYLYGGDHMYGGDGGDYMEGGAGADYMEGNDGTNTISGGSEDDTMHGGANVDYMYGNAGNDTMWGYAEDDRMEGGTGQDTLYGGANSDYLYGNYYSVGDASCDGLYGGDGPAGDDNDYCYCGTAWNDGNNLGECETTVGCGGC